MLEYIKTPFKIFSLLRRNPSPNDIAFGVCLGLFFGFIPMNGSMALLLAVFFFVFKINRIAALLALPLFKLLYIAGVKHLCNLIGQYLLIKAVFLTGFWAWFTTLPIIALLQINYTLVIGGLALSAALSPFVFFVSRLAAIKSGVAIADKLKTTKAGAWLLSKQAQPSAAAKPGLGQLFRRLKLANIIIIIVVLAVIQLGTGLVISPMARAFIIEKLNAATGSRLMAGGLNVWPLTLSVSLRDVKVFDPQKDARRIAKLDKASFSLSPLGLLSARAVISRAHLSGTEFTPEGVADSSFVGAPAVKGPKGPWDMASIITGADRNRDTLGRIFQIVKKSFSKKSADKAIEDKKASKKSGKQVTKLDFGEKVEFKRGSEKSLLEIRSLDIDDAVLGLDNTMSIKDAAIKIKGLTYDPVYGTDVRYVFIKGALANSGSSIGSAVLDMDKKVTGNRQFVKLDISVKGLDAAGARPLYEKTLPMYAAKGKLDFESNTAINNSEVDSRNRIVLRGQEILPRSPGGVVFGIVPVSPLCEALNSVDPLTLKFNITGSVEAPQMKGLEETLMSLVKPYMEKAIKEKVEGEGKKLLDKLIKDNM